MPQLNELLALLSRSRDLPVCRGVLNLKLLDAVVGDDDNQNNAITSANEMMAVWKARESSSAASRSVVTEIVKVHSVLRSVSCKAMFRADSTRQQCDPCTQAKSSLQRSTNAALAPVTTVSRFAPISHIAVSVMRGVFV